MKREFPLAAHHGAVLLSEEFSLDDPPEVTFIGVNLNKAVLPEKVTAEPWRSWVLIEHHHAYVLVPGLNQRGAYACKTVLASAITGLALLHDCIHPGMPIVFSGAAMTWFDVPGSIKKGWFLILVWSA